MEQISRRRPGGLCTYFERYVRVLFMYGSQFTGDRELVKDCIQDVFVKIYSNRSNLRPTDNIKYYLFAALRNSLLNNLKRNKVRFGGGGGKIPTMP